MLISYWSVTGFMPNWFFSFSSRKLVFSPVISVLLLDLCLLLIKHLLKLFFSFASWCAKHYCLNFNDPIWFTIQYFYLILHLSHLFSFLSFYFYSFYFSFFEFVTFEFDGATINLFFLIIVGCALFCSIVVALLLSCNFSFLFCFYCSYEH